MSRIIITNNSDLPDHSAVYMAMKVIEAGRISNFGKQYCYLATVGNWEGTGKSYQISSGLNKKSDRFIINNVQK